MIMRIRGNILSGGCPRLRTLAALAALIACLQNANISVASALTIDVGEIKLPKGSIAVSIKGAAKAPAVAASTAAVRAEPTVQDLYPLEKLHLRDPFISAGGGSSSGFQGGGEIAEFSIHNLTLKGILQDPSGDYALFVDASSGNDYVLRKNTLYNDKNKPVPGVSGIIKPQQKTVHLLTSDQDVQTFILGEDRGPE